MNWINNVVRPKLQGIWRKREMPDNLWIKCPESGRLVFHKDLEANQYVIPGSDFHMRMAPAERFASLYDEGEYENIEAPVSKDDPLHFKDERKYSDRLKDARAKNNSVDAVQLAQGKVQGLHIVSAVQDFTFMGGSLGTSAGSALVKGMTTAVRKKSPFVLFAASGGARMQEGILSLMQMPRVTVTVQDLKEAKLPFIVVLTHPTMGGVTASYAMLGDIHLAEPAALIGFAGPRVIEQTIREILPEGFQRSEYLLEKGMVDKVVHRHELPQTISTLCHLFMHKPKPKKKISKIKPAEKQLNGANGNETINGHSSLEKLASNAPQETITTRDKKVDAGKKTNKTSPGKS